MEKVHKDIMRENTVLLTRELTVDEMFLSHFVKDRVFTEANVEEILVEKTSHKRNAAFLRMIQRRGPKAFGVMINAMVETEQVHLAEALDPGLTSRLVGQHATGMPVGGVHAQETTPPVQPGHMHPSFPAQQHQQATGQNKAKTKVNNEGSAFMTVEVNPCNMMDGRFQTLINDKENTYTVYPRKRGRAIIINNETFMESKDGPKLGEREGTAYDLINLDKLFEKLHFQTYVYTNCKREEILTILKNESTHADHKDASAFVLCILSHGAKGYAYGVDGQKVSIEDEICSSFDGTNCPALHGKPKIFIIQACQGRESTAGVPMADSLEVDALSANLHDLRVGDQKDSAPTFFNKRHEKADMLIAYSTVGGYKSWRRPDLGSWFVRAIVDIFAERAHIEHVADMLTKVRRKVLEMQTSYAAGDVYVQVTKTDSTLSRDFYFFPGYIANE